MHPLIQEIYEGATPTWEVVVEALTPGFELLAELRHTPQEPEWHAEGNVHIHTGMVLEQTYELLRSQAAQLDAERRLALILGAIFHDIAKPLVTRTQEIRGRERIVAPRHADRGRSYLAYRLLNLGLPYPVVSQVLALVGHHHDLLKLVRQDAPAHKYRRLARMVDLELVYYLEIADMLGRSCRDQQEQLDALELFRMFAKEYGVWGVTDPYAAWRQEIASQLSDESEAWRRFVEAKAIREAEANLIYTPEEAIARAYDARDGYAHLVILCGPSGAGKSTWAHNNLPEYEPVSLDDLRAQLMGKVTDQSANGRVRQLARDQLKEHLRHKRNVVWDATNLRRDFRAPLVDLGVRYGAYVTIAAFHITEADVFTRNAQRQRSIPTTILQKQLRNMEWPYLDEAHELLLINKAGERWYP